MSESSELLVKCDCTCHYLKFTTSDDLILLEMYELAGNSSSMWGRIKAVYKLLTQGNIGWDIMLTKHSAKQIITYMEDFLI